jgi:hypothetical protein
MRRAVRSLVLVLVTVLAPSLAPGCGDGGSPPPAAEPDVPSDASGDTDASGDADAAPATCEDAMPPGSSWYAITIVTQTNPAKPHVIACRDLTEKDGWWSFGSSHIGTAVAFSVTDTWTTPFRVITFDFGKVVPGRTAEQTFEQETTGPGEYPFLTTKPPAIEVNVEGLQYKSTVEGSEGAIQLTDFGDETGERMAGTFEGTLVQETDKNPNPLHVEVSGAFHFVLPQKDSGQPR